jgi:hypothetical protein
MSSWQRLQKKEMDISRTHTIEEAVDMHEAKRKRIDNA